MLTGCLAVYPYHILGHRTHFCQYDIQSTIEIKYLIIETSVSPLGKRDSLQKVTEVPLQK